MLQKQISTKNFHEIFSKVTIFEEMILQQQKFRPKLFIERVENFT